MLASVDAKVCNFNAIKIVLLYTIDYERRKKIIIILQLMNSIIPNLKLHCSFMLKVLKFKGRLVCEFKFTFSHFK